MPPKYPTAPPAGAYLEAALASGAADPAVYEQELARIYLERVVGASSAPAASAAPAASSADGTAAPGQEPGAEEPAALAPGAAAAAAAGGGAPPGAAAEYRKLRQLVLASRHLDYEALLRVAPQQRLLELRAALLERLGRWGRGGALGAGLCRFGPPLPRELS